MRHPREVLAKFNEHKTLAMGLRQRVKKHKLTNSIGLFRDSPLISKKRGWKRGLLLVKLNRPYKTHV